MPELGTAGRFGILLTRSRRGALERARPAIRASLAHAERQTAIIRVDTDDAHCYRIASVTTFRGCKSRPR